eukprot:12229578-Heterocapsa_arctica.AAC.2
MEGITFTHAPVTHRKNGRGVRDNERTHFLSELGDHHGSRVSADIATVSSLERHVLDIGAKPLTAPSRVRFTH